MRDYLLIYINGQRHEVVGTDAFRSLSDFLRTRLRLTGTKIVCEEGDCGSCTVLIGRVQNGEIRYFMADSCIAFLFQLDATHIVTVEGLSRGDGLTPVQQAMVDCHGSQCGFCTPGFVVAMTGLLESTSPSDTPLGLTAKAPEGDFRERNPGAWRTGLTGNLCRCTGYVPILEAGRSVDLSAHQPLNDLYPPAPLLADFATVGDHDVQLAVEQNNTTHRLFAPRTIGRVVRLRASHQGARLVAGATDVGVQINKGLTAPEVLIDLNRVTELEGIQVTGDHLLAGARATWSDLEKVCSQHFPEFAEIISIFGSPQIRNMGTIGGNIANASPIADSLPLLHVMEAELELVGNNGSRQVNINRFYQAYKQFDLQPDEIIARVRIPLPAPDEHLRLYKVSRRRDLDTATFTGAIRIQLLSNRIATASIALGAVGPTVLRLPKTEQFLVEQPFTVDTMQAAGELAAREVTPISDVRGTAEYRCQLTRNVLLKFYHQVADPV